MQYHEAFAKYFSKVNTTWNKIDKIKSGITLRLNFPQPCSNLRVLSCFSIRKELLLFFFFKPTYNL